jgi:hypothetical protein
MDEICYLKTGSIFYQKRFEFLLAGTDIAF